MLEPATGHQQDYFSIVNLGDFRVGDKICRTILN